ncbi:MAG TPA: glycosyltransferase family 9 protein [Gemmatimonadales bacterium]|jgi:heptosyltransferase-2
MDAGTATETAPRSSRASQVQPFTRGLVIQTAFPGDVILSTPLIRRAAERLGSPVDVVAIPAAATVLQNNPHIREVIVFDKQGKDKGIGGFWRMAQKLRSRRYGTAYLAQGSMRSALLAFVARIPRRIGFRGAAGHRFYTHAVMDAGEPHQIEKLLRLADGAPDRREPEIYPSARDREAVDTLLAEAGISGDFVALAPGSAWATKRWPYYPELARALSSEIALAIVGGPGDRADARAIKTALGGATIADGTGRLNMLQSGELIRRARILVSNDSAPVHLASAVGTPVVEIYGPTVPQFGFAARPELTRIVEPDPMQCRPCSHHGPAVCPLVHHKCMRDTPIASVLAEVRTILQIVRVRARRG